MHLDGFGPLLLVDDVAEASAFFVDHLGFRAAVRIDWFVSLVHDDRPEYELSFVRRGHALVPAAVRDRTTNPVLFFVVPDAAKEATRLQSTTLRIAQPLQDYPWGNRNFIGVSPGGGVIDIVQIIPPAPEFLAEYGLGAP